MADTDAFQQPNFGQNNKNWLHFLETIAKKKIYINRVSHFFEWRKANGDGDEQADLIKYFHFHHGSLEGQKPPKEYAPSILRQWHSIFSQFWKWTGRGDINDFTKGIPVLDRLVAN